MKKMLIICAVLIFTAGNVSAQKAAHPFTENSMTTVETTVILSKSISLSMKPSLSMALVNNDDAIVAGADYLKHAQADVTEDNAGNGAQDADPDDGGWDWSSTSFTHSASSSPKNTYGATAQGLYYAYLETADATYMTAMKDAADYMIGDAGIRSAADLIFLMKFQDLPGVTADIYQDAAKLKYDGRISTYGTATAFAEYIRDVRGLTQPYPNGIIGWDIGAYVVTAQMLYNRFGGTYDQDADDMAEVIWQDSFNNNPGLFDVVADAGFDPTGTNKNFWWYTLGITGLIDAFNASGSHTTEISGLVTILLDSQYPGGGFSGSYGANLDDEDWQSTAYTVMSLASLDLVTYQNDINRACFWIGSTQDASSGGWVYGSGNHYPEVGGENTAALYFGENPSEVWIDDDYFDGGTNDGHLWEYDAFATIQEGIDAVTHSTVNVAAGTYIDPITIDKSVDIIGAGAATTFVTGGVLFATGTFTGVTIDGLTLTGDHPGEGHDSVISMAGSGVVTDITIQNCVLDGESTSRICFYGRTGRVGGTWTWDNNTIKDFRSWYVIDNTGSNNYPGVPLTSVVFTDNIITGLGGTIVFRGKLDEPMTSATISGNTMTDWVDNSSVDGWIWAAIEINNVSYLEVFNNIMTGVPAQGDEGQGLQIWSVTPWTVDIHNNTITGNNEGIYIPGYVAAINMACYIPSGSVSNNNISSNTIFGLGIGDSHVAGAQLDATCNWWGNASGPNHPITNSGGTGNAVSDYVTFLPWLMTYDLDGSCIGGTPYGKKLGVISELRLLLTGDKKTDKKLQEAIKHIEHSRDPKLWIDDQHLDPKHGKKVFDEEKKAVKELEKLQKDKKTDEELKDAVEPIIETLVNVDLELVNIALAEVVCSSDKCEKEIEKVNKELDKAAKERDKGHMEHAIDKYKKAWEHTQHAIKHNASMIEADDTDEFAEISTSAIPNEFSLGNNYPNPFNPTTLISYNLPKASQVTMTVYDLMGKRVKTLVQEFQPAGNHSVIWNATNDNGTKMSGGMYFYEIRAGSFQQTHKMILLK